MGKLELKEDATRNNIQSGDWLKMKKTKTRKEDGRYVIFYSFAPEEMICQEEVREGCQNSDGTPCSKNG